MTGTLRKACVSLQALAAVCVAVVETSSGHIGTEDKTTTWRMGSQGPPLRTQLLAPQILTPPPPLLISVRQLCMLGLTISPGT